MEKNTICKVVNRTATSVSYKVPDSDMIRRFSPGEPKEITFEELQKLSYSRGGENLLKNYLRIEDKAVLRELGIETEPEYHMSEEEIKKLLREGSIESFLDCLDFAPIGVIDVIKKLAIELPLTDMNKIEALKKSTGFDVHKVLANLRAEKNDSGEEEKVAPKRRVEEKPERRTPHYEIVG